MATACRNRTNGVGIMAPVGHSSELILEEVDVSRVFINYSGSNVDPKHPRKLHSAKGPRGKISMPGCHKISQHIRSHAANRTKTGSSHSKNSKPTKEVTMAGKSSERVSDRPPSLLTAENPSEPEDSDGSESRNGVRGGDPSSSSSSSSSSDEDSSSESENERKSAGNASPERLRFEKKPDMSMAQFDLSRASKTTSMLDSFLTQMAASNAELEAEDPSTRGGFEIVDGEQEQDGGKDGEETGQYIEMNLGLGVLEEKGDEESSSDSSDDEDITEDPLGRLANVQGQKAGTEKSKRKRMIEEVSDD